MARVNFAYNAADFGVLLYGSLGMSTAFIAAKTGLTPGQINYRLKLQQVKRSDYREGKSQIASAVVSKLKTEVSTQIKRKLR